MTLQHMDEIRIGDVAIASLVERNGPWRKPEELFAECDPEWAREMLSAMEPFVYDAARGRLVIAYHCFVVRTPHHTVLVDSCTGEHKGYAAPLDYSRAPWLDRLRALMALALGADFVLCGRAIMYAVGALGLEGAKAAIAMLVDETNRCLGQIGY